ncbi:hypothetical protein [Prochlorothrix hollandica]|uniref:Uncharacterized protein n=1 Tax=Prochlorothrix hollandica PCC 9006 = CALU 1027 TaxID=317619 RepID=A0A0M2PZ26_PROHO|nr:hypothetical protein [Prochlorothrix hollandica]KKI99646.1 hypothetical protein PROH_07055 [Prochlorothrix hollandica PCC 9006 = CALU 1027]
MKTLLMGMAAIALTPTPAIAQLPECPSINYYLDSQGVCHDLDYIFQGTARPRQPQHPFPRWLTSREPWAIAQQEANLTSWVEEGDEAGGGGLGTFGDRWRFSVLVGSETIGGVHQVQEIHTDCLTGWRMSYRELNDSKAGTGSFTFSPPSASTRDTAINACLESGIVPGF